MNSKDTGKLIIFSAPSGSGKTTIVRELIAKLPQLEFSVSATSRLPRVNEVDGHDYYFYTAQEFEKAIEEDKFVEWEEVYAGTYYGTLRSELDRVWSKGNVIIFDVDVKGGVRLKNIFGDKALSIFVMPPSIEELRNRLVGRGTDNEESIGKRLAKASLELEYADKFDAVVVNDDLRTAIDEVENVISDFIK